MATIDSKKSAPPPKPASTTKTPGSSKAATTPKTPSATKTPGSTPAKGSTNFKSEWSTKADAQVKDKVSLSSAAQAGEAGASERVRSLMDAWSGGDDGKSSELLRRGSHDVGAVKELQTQLGQHLGRKLAVDGSFGRDTERAVRAFQRRHHLKVDGKVGPQTRRALREEMLSGGKAGGSAHPHARGEKHASKHGRAHTGERGKAHAARNGRGHSTEHGRKASESHTDGKVPKGRHLPDFSRIPKNASARSMVTVRSNGRNFRMRAQTARKFQEFVKLMNKHHPGVPIRITSTTTGTHSSHSHKDGRAVDFALSMRGGGRVPTSLTNSATRLARKAGFYRSINEYIKHTRHKTGPHIHAAF